MIHSHVLVTEQQEEEEGGEIIGGVYATDYFEEQYFTSFCSNNTCSP